MSQDDSPVVKHSYLSSFVTLFASTSTLVCCALPALLVSLGAGAALASLVSVFPQIVWVSENKEAIFLISSLLMIMGGIFQFRNRYAPCPIDPALRQTCIKTRKVSLRIYLISLFLLLIGGWFAFIQPLL
jgi:UDP-N-acetylmuramyl pentapeptide phosphotransferase/UDP-N-acetylglucosamine-1-phosphate transferase